MIVKINSVVRLLKVQRSIYNPNRPRKTPTESEANPALCVSGKVDSLSQLQNALLGNQMTNLTQQTAIMD